MADILSFFETYPVIVFPIIAIIFIVVFLFRKKILLFIQDNLGLILFFIVVAFNIFIIISKVSDDSKEKINLELTEAENSLYSDFEDYSFKDEEIPDVSLYGYCDEENSTVLVSVRFYDKFDSYIASKQKRLVDKYNVFFSTQLYYIISHSDYYDLNNSSWIIEIQYDTNDKDYNEYYYTGTLE